MNSKTKILIGILVIVIVLIGGWWIWNSIAGEKESEYSLIEWEELYNTKSGEKIGLVGYLTSAIEYTNGIFREEENYQFLSPNKGYPLVGQIPLIINQEIECNDEVEVNGKIVLRKGSAGKGISGTTDYVLLKVERWKCLNTTKTDSQEIWLKKTTAETMISDANEVDLPIITIAEEAALHDGELVRIIGEFQIVGSKSESGKKYWINTMDKARKSSLTLHEVLFDLSFDPDKFSEIETLNKKRVMATGRIKYIPIEYEASEPQHSTLYLEKISEFKGTTISLVQQPYIFYGKRTFTVGSLYLPEESKFGTPIPKMKGEDIFRFYIKSDIYPVRVKIQEGKEDIEIGDLEENPFFFTGYVKSYFINNLIKENPDIEWLKSISLGILSVFEIEHMIPVEDNDSVLSVDMPDTLSDEFEISVTIKNVLQIPLVDTKLITKINPGSSTFIISDKDRTSYYDKTIEGKYEPGETKTHKIKFEKNSYWRERENPTEFEITVTFAGYGIEGDEEEVLLEASKIKPLYSKEIRKYQLLWIKD